MGIKLGQRARDRVTGFTGICIARTEWLNGCIRITLEPPLDKDGKAQEARTIDEPQLELVDDGIRKDMRTTAAEEAPRKKTGGPIPTPKRAKDPGR
jgi:hypothetical protein